MDISNEDKTFIPYHDEDGYDWDEDEQYFTRAHEPSAIPNVHFHGKPLTEEDVTDYDATDDIDMDRWIEESLLSDDLPPSPTLQSSQITIGTRLISRLPKKKREAYLSEELGHHDIVHPSSLISPTKRVSN